MKLLIDDPLIDYPGYLGRAQGNPDYDWNFLSVAQEQLAGQQMKLSRGKMLGGSSGLNYMSYTRASIDEYDAWERLGNPGWNWDNMLPYFRNLESVTSPDPLVDAFPGTDGRPLFDASLRGFDGPIQVSHATFYSNLTDPSSKP